MRKNIFLDSTYFENLRRKKKVQNVTGKEKGLWSREEGHCFYCGIKLFKEDKKEVIKVRGICAYVHASCMENEVAFEREYTLENLWQEKAKEWDTKQQESQ